MTTSVYSRTFEVRWADLDPNRHLKNTAYSEYATHLRFSFMEEHGFPQQRFEALKFGPVIFREETRFHKEVVSGDAITVGMEVLSFATTGVYHIRHPIHRADGQKAAVVELEGAFFSLETRRLCRPPAELRELLLGLHTDA